jgi:hypothetical protein
VRSDGLPAGFADALIETARGFNDRERWALKPRSPRNSTTTTLARFAADVFAPAYAAAARR